VSATLEPLRALRQVRDQAQTAYAHARQHAVAGTGSRRELDAKRAAYLAAQGAYRDALLPTKPTAR
jgi:multidrug resistance efflux pump